MGYKISNYYGWPGNIWVFSDPHFNHFNIMRSERTEFKTIAEHNSAIVDGINSLVHDSDTLICLGDLGFHWEEYIKAMHGERKILIMGNHDNGPKYKYYDAFDMVFDGPIFLNRSIVLSHEPWPGCGDYCINIHGHLHNAWLDKKGYFNVNVAQTGYKPVNVADIYSKNTNLLKNHEPFLNEWYSKYYYFKFDTHSELPIKNHKLIHDSENIRQYINEFNLENKSKYTLHDIDWTLYDDSDLKTFIYVMLNKKGEENK